MEPYVAPFTQTNTVDGPTGLHVIQLVSQVHGTKVPTIAKTNRKREKEKEDTYLKAEGEEEARLRRAHSARCREDEENAKFERREEMRMQ
ncbi:uncharacterized protein G2W53_005683 [Senna tora]|uniref:Uncharacterized protein n=1 Tax=Senna tora TaxID=362788 RepID=A0A834X2Q9_9FABA|nr:uncharacterized protein G2W53_005683 [Senna tora]